MGILGGKLLLLFILLAVGLGVMISDGWVTVKSDGYSCLGSRGWYAQVDKQRLFAIGKLNVNYQPMNWGCNEDRRYDSSVYTNVGGRLEVKQ